MNARPTALWRVEPFCSRMGIVVRTVLYAGGGSPIASTTSATLDSPRSHRTSMRRYSASVRVGDFLRGMCRGYHSAVAVSTKVLRRSDEKLGGVDRRTAAARATAVLRWVGSMER